MIIIFLKYYSVRKAQESAEKKKKKQDLSSKDTKEARAAAQDPISRPKSKPVPEVLLGESLG